MSALSNESFSHYRCVEATLHFSAIAQRLKKGDIKMKKTNTKKVSSFILCIVLIVAIALFTTGCNGKENAASSAPSDSKTQTDSTIIGEGSTSFPFTVVDREGGTTQFEVHTDKETVGEALMEVGLIEGEDSEYGLFVKTVNGITADYDNDGVYWAFYINEDYAVTGVDSTPIADGESYSFKVEK